MRSVPTHIAKVLFDDSGARRAARPNRGRFDMPPRRRSPRAGTERSYRYDFTFKSVARRRM